MRAALVDFIWSTEFHKAPQILFLPSTVLQNDDQPWNALEVTVYHVLNAC